MSNKTKKIFKVLFSITVIGFLFGFNHDYHTSVTNISYNSELKVYSIDIEIDTEQFERTLSDFYGKDIVIDDNAKDTDELINNYINEVFRIRQKKKTYPLVLNRKEIDYSLCVLYFEDLSLKKEIGKTTITNKLLLSLYPMQKNLVLIYYKGKKASLFFDKDSNSDMIKF